MQVLVARQVSYTEIEDGQEYFQVFFEGAGQAYVLLQRVFEGPSDGRVYFECRVSEDIGHYVFRKVRLERERLVLKLPGLGGARWEVRFEIDAERYAQLAENLRVIFAKPNRLEQVTPGSEKQAA